MYINAEMQKHTYNQGFSYIEKMLARAKAVFPSANEKSRAPKAKKPVFITRAMHVSEYVLNSMFQVGYSRTLVLF